MREAFRYVSEKYGKERAERLFVLNPRAAVDGKDLPAFEPEKPLPRKWYEFWA
jgi:hypothetical protein